jgi:hypothetical protein
MKTIVIVGGTREAALKRLRKMMPNDGIIRNDFFDEVALDDHRVMAIGGGPDDVCWLRDVGFAGVEIITVGDDGISEAMWGRIRQIRSTSTVYSYVDGKRYEKHIM